MTAENIDDLPVEVADLIASRRDEVARTAVRDLGKSSTEDLPQLLHRLAGKLGAFGHEAAGEAARELMIELGKGVPAEVVPGRVQAVIALLQPPGKVA